MASKQSLPGIGGPDWLILAHSQGRWGECLRPDQVLLRLAAVGRVVYVEPPVFREEQRRASIEVSLPSQGVERVVPVLPATLSEQESETWLTVRRLLHSELGLGRPPGVTRGVFVHWFSTPVPAPDMLNGFGEAFVVYDCDAPAASLADAPADADRRESMLLARADLVFANGPGVQQSLSARHRNVHPAISPVGGDASPPAQAEEWTRLSECMRDLIALWIPRVRAAAVPAARPPQGPQRRPAGRRRRLVRPDG